MRVRLSRKRKTLLVCVLIGVLYGIMLIPNQRKISWQPPATFLVPPANAFYKILVNTTDATYLFYANHSMFSINVFDPLPLDQPFLINESIFYMKQMGSTWDAPILLNVSMPDNSVKYLQFAIGYDLVTKKFHVFASTWNPRQYYRIWHTAGPLGALPPLEPIIFKAYTDNWGDFGMPCSLSPAFGPTGETYLAYELLTGVSENLNEVKILHTTEEVWGEEEDVGIGNSPRTFVDAEGRVFIYSNLWTFTWGPQNCVDEWASSSTGSWTQAPVRTSAKDWYANPLVVEASDGSAYLFYNTREGIVVHTAGSAHWWSYYTAVVGGLENDSYPLMARVEVNTLTLYYIYEGEIKVVTGTQESGLMWYFPPLDQVWDVIGSIFSFIPNSSLLIPIFLILIIIFYILHKYLHENTKFVSFLVT